MKRQHGHVRTKNSTAIKDAYNKGKRTTPDDEASRIAQVLTADMPQPNALTQQMVM